VVTAIIPGQRASIAISGAVSRHYSRIRVRVGRKGLFSGDVYADATEIERVEDGTVHLAVPEDGLLPAGELARSAG
jgi:hypothetical protein